MAAGEWVVTEGSRYGSLPLLLGVARCCFVPLRPDRCFRKLELTAFVRIAAVAGGSGGAVVGESTRCSGGCW